MNHDRTVSRNAFAVLGALLFAFAMPAAAEDEQNLSLGLTAEGKPLAMHGYDPVAYFTLGAPTLGSAAHAVVHDGATYYFVSDDHAKRFRKSPAKYAPQFGGYCAFGVSVGKKFDADPRFWAVADGRLFLNLNADIAKMFQKDVPGAVAKADGQWRKIERKAVGAL